MLRSRYAAGDVVGITPVHVVASTGLNRILNLLLQDSCWVKSLLTPDVNGRTPLHEASAHGQTQTVRRLLQEKSIDIDLQDLDGMTSLQLAAEGGYAEVVSLLLKAHASIERRDRHSRSTLMIALSGRDELTARLIFEQMVPTNNFDVTTRYPPLNQTLLHQMSNLGYEEGVTTLLAMGAEPDAEDTCGYVPVHLAARKGHTKVVERLLQCSDGRVLPSYCNHTPLHLASKHGHKSTVELLLSTNPSDVNVHDFLGFTPLHSAAAAGQLDVVMRLTLLTELATSEVSPSPFQLALWGGHHEVLQFLHQYYLSPVGPAEFNLTSLRAIEQVAKGFQPRARLPYELNGLSSLAEHYGLTHLKAARIDLASIWYDIALLAYPVNSGILDPAKVINPTKCCDHCHVDPIVGPCYTCTSCVGPCYDLCGGCYKVRSELHRHCKFFSVPATAGPLPSLEEHFLQLEKKMRTVQGEGGVIVY